MNPEVTKVRKVVAGSIRNKERTCQRWLDAVGLVLREKGYTGLTIKNITDKAGLDRKLINAYFGDLNKLIDSYLYAQDYWMTQVAPQIGMILSEAQELGPKQVIALLHTLLDVLDQSIDLQKILEWEVSSYHPVLRQLADAREEMAKPLYEALNVHFGKNAHSVKGMIALQIAGIYYLVLHGKNNGSTFCEVDITTPEGKLIIKQAISDMVSLIYKQH